MYTTAGPSVSASLTKSGRCPSAGDLAAECPSVHSGSSAKAGAAQSRLSPRSRRAWDIHKPPASIMKLFGPAAQRLQRLLTGLVAGVDAALHQVDVEGVLTRLRQPAAYPHETAASR